MRECTLATCTTDMDYFKDEFEKGFTHPRAEKDGLHPELLDCSDTVPDTAAVNIAGAPKLGGHCYIKCKDGYKFAEYGDEGVASGWDENGRLKITCVEKYDWGHNGDFFGPIVWNIFHGNCDMKGWGCDSYPQCIPEDADP